jgi:preprotein translocase subunit SecD
MKVKSLVSLGVTLLLIVLVACLALNGLQVGKYIFEPVANAISLGLDLRGGVYAVYQAKDTSVEDFDSQLAGTISVLRNRLTAQGYTEATVTQQGSDRIRVEIPDVKDPGAILDIIGTPAKLEFVDPQGNVVIEGKDVKSAKLAQGGESGLAYVVAFELNDSGTEAFAKATAANIGQPIRILLDGEEISAPTVQSAITSGEGVITIGDGNQREEATRLALLIQSGALPLDIEQLEVSAVSATLGVEALDRALTAGIIGVALVMLFMIIMYRLPGVVADMALAIYILIVFYALALVPGVQLTLPGIAGILLGIGMAVDANVIIFERFREELKAERSLESSVKRGFKNALSAIIDSNVTTIIASLVLMYFGTGPIRGFAITLLISVIASMITAVFITRFLLTRVVRLGIQNKALYTR